jgi:L-ascorbate metabolism protein UlaG (beta-lactamase superfamily)
VPAPRLGGYHASDADLTITRLAHAGVLIDLGGRRFLVDPWLHAGVVLRPHEALGLHPDALPALHAVMLTHDDGLRVDSEALRLLAGSVPRAVAPAALHARLRHLGFRDVIDVPWWQNTAIDDVRVTAVPARGTGYALQRNGVTVYVAGAPSDTLPLAEIHAAIGPIDVALLPIGGRRVWGIRREWGPAEAAAAAVALAPRRVIPVAYGATGVFPFVTFAADAPGQFRADALDRGLAPERIVELAPGESWHYSR